MSRSMYARLSERFGPPVDPLTRRSFLATSVAIGVGGLLSCNSSPKQARSPAAKKRIVVIGAGLAGLMCAHELKSVGYNVVVVDARERVGGRVLTFRDFVPGCTVEAGGEYIGSNHPNWAACHDRFKLEFMHATDQKNLNEPLVLQGRTLSTSEAKALYEEMQGVLKRMTKDAALVDMDEPWKSPGADGLDKMSTAEWLAAQQCSPLCTLAIRVQLEADNGVAIYRQSHLANLAMIKGGGLDSYWTESEVFRCKGGNSVLALLLAKAIGEKNIVLKSPIKSINDRGDKMVLTTASGQKVEADDVVLTVAPSVWSKIEFGAGLLPRKLVPQMGTNVKFLAAVKSRFWLEAGLAPTSRTDGDVGETWDATDGQHATASKPGSAATASPAACLTAFSGGPAAERILARKTDKLTEAYVAELAAIYPRFAEQFIAARFMDWPSEIWTQGSYSFPAPGQVMALGPVLAKPSGGLHFAGEYTSHKFPGYMEGALDSGVAVARRIAIRDGVAS